MTNVFLSIATFLSKHGKAQIYVRVYGVAAPNHNAQRLDNVKTILIHNICTCWYRFGLGADQFTFFKDHTQL